MEIGEDWQARVGTNPWRNLISLECTAMQRLGYAEIPRAIHVRTGFGAAACENSQSFGWCYVGAANDAVLLWMAGREFVIAPTHGVVASLESAIGRRYVILLDWNEEVAIGLRELWQEATPISVLTSWWIWEELSPVLGDVTLIPGSILEMQRPERAGADSRLLGFEASIEVSLGLEQQLRIETTPAPTPSLEVTFTCNGAVFRVGLGKGAPPGMTELASEVWRRACGYPALRNFFEQRYRVRYPSNVFPGIDLISPSSPVDTRMLGDGPSTFQPSFAPNPLALPPVGEIAGDIRESLSSTVFAIFCGGVSGGVLDATRRLRVRLPGQKRSTVVSILVWRLTELSELVNGPNERVNILLVVSAEIEEALLSEVERLNEEVQSRLDITVVRQQCVPRLAIQGGRFAPVRGVDGAWELGPPGHGDFLLRLASYRKKNSEIKRCMAFAHNNLGTLLLDLGGLGRLNRYTLRGLAALREVPLAVETFVDPSGVPASELAFSSTKVGGRLFKQWYPGVGEGFPVRAYSSHTWYVDLTQIEVLKELIRGYRMADGWPRQELEQATHGEIPVKLIEYDVNSTPESDERFLIARTEDDFRDRCFLDRFDKLHAVPKSSVSRPAIGPIVELVPTEMRNIWGSDRLRYLKRQPPALVGETWEVSTHSAGPSTVGFRIGESIPIAELIGVEDGYRELPFMVKYLDCDSALSLQVHPSEETVRYLSTLPPGLARLNDTGSKTESFFVLEPPVTDDTLVNPAHLYLGFDCEAVAPFASCFAPSASSEKIARDLADLVGRKVKELMSDDRAISLVPDFDRVQEVIAYQLSRYDETPNLRDLLGAIGAIWFTATVIRAVEKGDLQYPVAAFHIRGLFHPVKVQRNQLVQIPPGMVHAWLGGGTVAIELSDCSDNTFRFFDHGRELSPATCRRMHHLEAMYSLVPEAVLRRGEERRFISDLAVEAGCWHPLLGARLHAGNAKPDWIKLHRSGDYSFVMNPDGPVHIRANGPKSRQLTLGPCRTAMIVPGSEVSVYIPKAGDRLVEIWSKGS